MSNPRLASLFRTYPNAPGFKAPGTSQAAAEAFTAPAAVLRLRVLACITGAPEGKKADEIAEQLNCPIRSVRPRVSELHRDGKIEETGARRKNASGMSANVWRLAPPPRIHHGGRRCLINARHRLPNRRGQEHGFKFTAGAILMAAFTFDNPYSRKQNIGRSAD
jgi:hypothetical protein